MPGSNSRPNVSEGYEVPTELPGSTGLCNSILLLPCVMVLYYIVSVLFLLFFWCPCIAINVINVQYNGGLLPDIILLTQ